MIFIVKQHANTLFVLVLLEREEVIKIIPLARLM